MIHNLFQVLPISKLVMEESLLNLFGNRQKELGSEFFSTFLKTIGTTLLIGILPNTRRTRSSTANSKLQSHGGNYLLHQYFRRQYFDKISAEYTKVKQNIQQLEVPLTSATSPEVKDDISMSKIQPHHQK